MFEFTFNRYVRFFSFGGLVLGIATFVESRSTSSQGVVLLSWNIALLWITAFKEWKSKVSSWLRLGWLISLGIADLLWMLAFYVFDFSSRSPVVLVPIALAYGTGFLCAGLSALQLMKFQWDEIRSSAFFLSLNAAGLIVAGKFLIFPYLKTMGMSGYNISMIGEIYAVSASLFLFSAGLTYMLLVRSMAWELAFGGSIALVFADWGMRSEKLLGSSVSFGPYELYWSVGVLLTVCPFWCSGDSGVMIDSIERAKFSLSFRLKAMILGIVATFLSTVAIFTDQSFKVVQILSVASGVMTVFGVIYSHFAVRWIVSSFETFGRLVDLKNEEVDTASAVTFGRSLPHELADSFEKLFSRNFELAKGFRRKIEIGKMAQQVAHDIRSPLSAIAVLEKDLSVLPEDRRIMLRGAVNRLHDIANDLLRKNTSDLQVAQKDQAVVLVSALLEDLVTEKRVQYRSKMGVEILGLWDEGVYGLFVSVLPSELKRVISNLINNSVEAIGESGRVQVQLNENSNDVEIRISDNGKGISGDNISKVFERGVSVEKPDGSGLGLFHARRIIEGFGGKLVLESELGVGTVVIVLLPRANSPGWFLERLEVRSGAVLVVVDDDSSIHQIWKNRFDSMELSQKCTMKHFSTPAMLLQSKELADIRNAIYLIDYEFLGSQKNGLDLIEELSIANCSVLVTSRFEETSILKRCEEVGVKMIPKGLARDVPIVLKKIEKQYDLVLIDDDPLIHLSWKIHARETGRSILIVTSKSEFESASKDIAANIPIYIDSNLGNGIKGEDVAKQLFDLGYSVIYLATGYRPDRFPKMPWIKGIVGKEPQF